MPISLSLPPLPRGSTWLDDEVPNTAHPLPIFPQRTISVRPPDTRVPNEPNSAGNSRSRSNDSTPLRNIRPSSVANDNAATSADEQTCAGRSTSNGCTDTEAENDADVEKEDADRNDVSQSASIVQPPPQVDVGMTILEPGFGLNMDLLMGVRVGVGVGIGVNVDPEGIATDINGRELRIGARELVLRQQQQLEQPQGRERDREHERPLEQSEDPTSRAQLTALPDAGPHLIPPRQPTIANLHQRTHINPT